MSQSKFYFANYIGSVVGKTARLIANSVNKALVANGYKVSFEQMITLNIIALKEGVSQQDIACMWQKNKASITNLIDQLEKNNLVVRVSDKLDRRNNLLYLTDDGKKKQIEMGLIAKFTIDKLLVGVNPDDLDICIKVLKQMITNCSVNKHKL